MRLSPLPTALILLAAALLVWLFVANWPDWLTGIPGRRSCSSPRSSTG
jgi:hypothetical protein